MLFVICSNYLAIALDLNYCLSFVGGLNAFILNNIRSNVCWNQYFSWLLIISRIKVLGDFNIYVGLQIIPLF